MLQAAVAKVNTLSLYRGGTKLNSTQKVKS